MRIFKWLASVLRKINQDPVETYLANSTDLADCENRQRILMRGEAPFQNGFRHARDFQWND